MIEVNLLGPFSVLFFGEVFPMLMPIFTLVRANFQKVDSDDSRNTLATILGPLSTCSSQRMKIRDAADIHVSALVYRRVPVHSRTRSEL